MGSPNNGTGNLAYPYLKRRTGTDHNQGETVKLERSFMKLSEFTGRQWRGLVILMLVHFVDYVDRQIVFALFPYLRHDFGLTRFQLGTLATAFTIVLSLASFPLGMLADRISRRAV